MFKTISKAIGNPQLALSVLQSKYHAFFQKQEPEFVSSDELRSDSDNGFYIASVRKAVESYEHFKNFKRDPVYNEILEHVSKEQGNAYLQILKKRKDGILASAKTSLLLSDNIGNPVKHQYDAHGPLSPTTLRYLKVASDLKLLFGNDLGSDIAEIGCGYGGQLLVCEAFFNFRKYHLFDLPYVNKLIEKYLESFLLNGAYETHTLNSAEPSNYDLVISNYAFSELTTHIQRAYIRKVLAKAKRGYLTMNSGKVDFAGRDDEKLSLDELTHLLPPFTVFNEEPLTAPNNYIIAWGHNEDAQL